MEMIQNAIDVLAPHWPFMGFTFLCMLMGQVMAHRVFTRVQAHKKRPSQWFWWWMRKTLPLHGAAFGFLVGMLWQDPEGVDWPWIASPMYFAFAGGVSVWAYEVIKHLAMSKGMDFSKLPGESLPPEKGDKK